MRIVEIRDLDGPNLFLMSPAIKVEIGDVPEESQAEVIARLTELVHELHEDAGVVSPAITSMRMETPGQVVVAFGWDRREFARNLGASAAKLLVGEREDAGAIVDELRSILAKEPDEDDAPLLIRRTPGRVPIVSITGTNGKTTTSRLIDFVLREAGFHVGLTSSAGVFIDNEQVLEGDYSGPSGARRALADPKVEYAILETARGGLLLRGCGFEEADVAVVTNVTADHLGIHGVHTIEGLAEVKSIIARNVKPGGFCVLNANDENVLAMREQTPGEPVLFSPSLANPDLQAHIAAGGHAITVDDDRNVVWFEAGESRIVTSLAEIPMTFDGRASHQVENALAAIAALIGLGLSFEQIHDGVANFKSTSENSKGRLNIFQFKDATVIIDFAHNEAGLTHLLNFGRSFVEGDGRLISVIGTAGDRDDASIRGIAQCAVKESDMVVLKDSAHYLRGRQPGEMLGIMREAILELGDPETEILEGKDERSAVLMMLDKLQPNDVLAVMCIEDYKFLIDEISKIGEEIA